MKRWILLLLLLVLGFGSTPLFANACVSNAATCSPGPCNASAVSSWTTCGGVVPTITDTIKVLAGHDMILDRDLDVLAGNNGTTGGIEGRLRSDNGRRSLTWRCTAGVDQYLYLSTGTGGLGTLDLKGGDRMVAYQIGGGQCDVNFFGAPSILNNGTISATQTGSVNNVGTSFTVGGITTTGFAVGDEIWWTSGNAQSYVYELTAVTPVSVSYQTDFPDASSLDLHLTPHLGALGGVPLSLHTLPNVTPVTGDTFVLVAPVKWTYAGGRAGDAFVGGAWRILPASPSLLDPASNMVFDGFSIVSSDLGVSVNNLQLNFPTNYAAKRSFRFMNLADHRAQSPYMFRTQKTTMDYIYCHDAIAGAGATPSCMTVYECTVGLCGVAFGPQDIFLGHIHGDRTASMVVTVGTAGGANDPTRIVVWEPVFANLGNAPGTEALGIEIAECDDCLIYRGRCWNVNDPDGTPGMCYGLSANTAGTSVIADSYAVNTGVGIGGPNKWTIVNDYVANTKDQGIFADSGGQVYSSVVYKWGLNDPAMPAIQDASVDGAIILGGTTQASASAWTSTAGPSAAITLRNMVVKGYKATPAIQPGAANDVNVTMEHITCGGPSIGTASCIDLSASTVDVTYSVKDIAVNTCGSSGTAVLVCSADAGTVDNSGKIARDSDVCAVTSGVCSVATTEVPATDLKFTNPAGNDYNVIDPTSVLWRAGVETGSFLGARCISFDPSRFAPGLTIDANWTDVATESCYDGDRDGYMAIVEGTNTIDKCPGVTDIRNLTAGCTNGALIPGRRVFP